MYWQPYEKHWHTATQPFTQMLCPGMLQAPGWYWACRTVAPMRPVGTAHAAAALKPWRAEGRAQAMHCSAGAAARAGAPAKAAMNTAATARRIAGMTLLPSCAIIMPLPAQLRPCAAASLIHIKAVAARLLLCVRTIC